VAERVVGSPSAAPASPSRRSEERHERLLASALALFAGQGFHETSVDQIVAAARTSKSAFYASFAAKEDCFRVLLAQEGGQLLAAAQDAAGRSGGDHRDSIASGIRGFVEACFRRAPVARLLLVESVGLAAEIEIVRAQLHAAFAALVEADVRRGRAQGDFHRVDSQVWARAVVGAVNEVVGMALREGSSVDPTALAEQLGLVFGSPAQKRKFGSAHS